ncbi:MAG: hypothetical protein B7X04_04360 [Parcubacteria group bacterium 21-54-25]|nr:MAG: hypothetical protein B7X04_04360 [Parcubacteria group bacterium 21-54-25]HQU08212.1 hypothetical protein [Candidatus Paceibacterota bacterium]
MEYRKDIWFSPRWVLACFYRRRGELGKDFQKHLDFKAMKEAWIVSVMMLGMMKRLGRGGWVQLVDQRKEATPDVRTGFLMNGPGESGKFRYQDVEVVTLTSHSTEPVEEFLKRTKLSRKKAYQADTIILCYVDKDLQTKKWTEIQQDLAATNASYDVYLLGRTDKDKHNYQLARVHPGLDQAVRFDIEEEIKKDYGFKNTLRLGARSMKPSMTTTDEHYRPF